MIRDIESQELLEQTPQRDGLRWVPVIGAVVGTYSALFATFVLYPWHIELSKEFASMQTSCLKV